MATRITNLRLDQAVDFKPFYKALDNLYNSLGRGKIKDKDLLEITDVVAGRILGQAANNTGVSGPKGKFSKSLRVGATHIKRKWTWPKPISRGKNKGKVKPVYPSAVKSIKYNRKVYTYSAWVTGTMYFQKSFYGGLIPIVEAGLEKGKRRALRRLGSGKASWYKIAKDNKLPVSSFQDKGQLGLALRSVTSRYRSSISSKKNKCKNRTGLEFTNSTNNSLNVHTKGLDAFRAALRGQSKAIQIIVRKGYINSVKDAFKHLRHTVK